MRGPIGSENKYLALDAGGGLFAIPICDTRGVVVGNQAMRPAVLPNMPGHVKCVVTVRGQLTTIITMPGDRTDMELQGKPIVILSYHERTMGVIASSVKLIMIPEGGISVDCLTGAKTCAEGSNIFSIVDTEILFSDKEYGA